MVNDSSKGREISPAAAVWAVVDILLVSRRTQMLVQGYKFIEIAFANTTLVFSSIGVP